jgi:hypothetical protein
MTNRRVSLDVLLVLVVAMSVTEASPRAAQLPRAFFGLRLGMNEEAARERLQRIAAQQKEEKEQEEGGEQEVWILKSDRRFNYLIARFDREHKLILLTAVARPRRVKYAELASLKLATKATDGMNYSYKWKVEPGKSARPFTINARGNSPEFLTSYSVYYTSQN